jgi:hypothetical protein
LLEAVGSTFPGVTQQTLGDMAGQINSWPHVSGICTLSERPIGFANCLWGLGRVAVRLPASRIPRHFRACCSCGNAGAR